MQQSCNDRALAHSIRACYSCRPSSVYMRQTQGFSGNSHIGAEQGDGAPQERVAPMSPRIFPLPPVQKRCIPGDWQSRTPPPHPPLCQLIVTKSSTANTHGGKHALHGGREKNGSSICSFWTRGPESRGPRAGVPGG